MAVALNLYTVPPHAPFLDAIARGWMAHTGDDPLAVSQGLILLPTRRSARALAEAFLRLRDGRPMLLPRVAALGALDEAPLTLAGALDVPPAVEPMQRLAALTRLILAMNGRNGAPRTADRAWRLAQELASLMDEAERSGIDLEHRLPDAADPAFAAHWNETLKFLHIVSHVWPGWLADNGVMNPAARQAALLDAQAEAWSASPPSHPVWVIGITAGIPAVARLLRVVAGLPHGLVVLPHLDLEMPDEAWAALEPTHAEAGLAGLLRELGATRGDVQIWPHAAPGSVPAHRFGLLSRALLPAEALHDWIDRTPVPTDGLHRLTPADPQQEAQAIALVLRQALEAPGAQAALVTPDRALAGRVAAALLRFGIIADDSAGEPLSETPPAVFLRLLARAVAEELAPVPLLSLLKHPLAAAGLTPAACRDAARALETACLRGPRPDPGRTGLRRAVETKQGGRLAGFLARLETCLEPALRYETAVVIPAVEALNALMQAAERLAATPDETGASRLWAGEEGAALAERLSAVRDAIGLLPDLPRGTLPGLLDAVLDGAVVRGRRALRGRTGAEHPRVFIWGLLEARLQSVDVAVLGGLAETVWPPVAEPGPWLSRPMRHKVGLPAPEETVGQAAHDFLSVCCSAPTVVLSCPVRRDGAPAVPARWLARLDMFLTGREGAGREGAGRKGAGREIGAALPEHPASAWAQALDLPAGPPRPVRPPAPRPPVALRPRSLNVTSIETWLRDPYAIYARHILKLEPLPPLEEATDAADYGSIVHAALHQFLLKAGAAWPVDAATLLRREMEKALTEGGLRKALQAWWAPRLERIADWVAETDGVRRVAQAPVHIAPEVKGDMVLNRPGGAFTLRGRADRIEAYPDGSLAIIDYKTGQPPSQPEVDAGLAPQLLLEAMMAAAGSFPGISGEASRLIYWHLSGGIDPGSERPLFSGKRAEDLPAAVATTAEKLCALIDEFDRPARAYLSRPRPDHADRFSSYEQLARVAEWSAGGGA